MAEIKAPVETTRKVRTYVSTLVEQLNVGTLSASDKIDVCCLLDDIHKQCEEYVKQAKKNFGLGPNIIEAEGTIGRARYAESKNIEIAPKKLLDEIGELNFLSCVKIQLKDLREKHFLSEERIQEIGVLKPATPKISLQLKIK